MPFSRLRILTAALIVVFVVVAGVVVVATGGGSHVNHPKAAARLLQEPALPPPTPKFALPVAAHPVPHAIAPPRLGQPANGPKRRLVGSPVNGQTLTTSTGTWTGNPTGYAYAWLDCDTSGLSCVVIPNASSNTYTVASGDIGHTIRSSVTASNPHGFSTTNSAATAVVIASGAAAPQSTVAPAVSGTPTQGQVLTTTAGTWSGSPTSYTYQWQDCDAQPACTDIVGATTTTSATTNTYTLAAPDVNHAVRATVTASSAAGSGNAASNLTAVITGSGAVGGTWDGTQEIGLSTTACTKYAAPGGNDSTGTGAIGAPYLTVQKLSDNLTSGQVGCLRAGTYTSALTTFSHAGVTITGAPGEAAWVDAGSACISAGATLTYLNFAPGDASGHSVDIEASNTVFEHNNVSQASIPLANRGNGIGVGWNACVTSSALTGVAIAYNRIHDFGNNAPFNHGIYISNVASSSFFDNWIYNNNYGAGIQFYEGNTSFTGPHDDQAYSNVIDKNLLGFYFYGENAAYNNIAASHNVITNQSSGTRGAGFEANSGAFSSNSFTTNDGYQNLGTWPCQFCGAMTLSGNITSNPQYADASYATSHDYRVSGSSPASSWGLWNGDFGGTSSSIVGNSAVGASSFNLGADGKRANCFPAGATGTASTITAYLQPSGVSGTQKITGAVYSYSSGPAALLDTTTELLFPSTASAGWYDLPLLSPLSVASGTTYCLALGTGQTDQVTASRFQPSGTGYYNSNTYGVFSNPYGTPNTSTATMSIYMSIG